MRSFVLSLVLFAVMLAGIAGNALFIHHLCDDLLARIDALPNQAQSGSLAAFDALHAHWERMHNWVSLSVSYVQMNQVRDALTAMTAHYANGTDADYFLAREQLRLAIEEMCRFEMLAWDNLI